MTALPTRVPLPEPAEPEDIYRRVTLLMLGLGGFLSDAEQWNLDQQEVKDRLMPLFHLAMDLHHDLKREAPDG